MTPCGYQQFSSGTIDTAQYLTVPTNGQQIPTLAIIVAIGDEFRWRDDGAAPSAIEGMILRTFTPFYYDGDLKNIRFISILGGGELNISYYYGNRCA